MKNTKKLVALLLAVLAIVSCFAMPTSAATTKSQKIVKWTAVNPSVASQNQGYYTIKGNTFSQKKVTVMAGGFSSNYGYSSDAINYYKNNARFRVDIYKNGTWQRAYTGKLGQYFYLPKGASKYTVVLTTSYVNFKSNNICWIAAQAGTCYLKY